MKYVGVTDFDMLEEEPMLKRAALMFDNLCLAYADIVKSVLRAGLVCELGPIRTQMALYEWLLENEILVPSPPVFGSDSINAQFEKFLGGSDFELTYRERLKLPDPIYQERLRESRLSLIRQAAMTLERNTDWETVSFDQRDDRSCIVEPGEDVVAQVVFRSIPVPNASTPWEDILSYRRDPESRTRFLRLKHWINDAIAQEKDPRHLFDEVQTLLAEYESHMRLHRMKTSPGMLETLVTTTAELIEGLVKFKWGDAAESLFALRQRKIKLLEAERVAPGRQLAYLADVRRTFGRNI